MNEESRRDEYLAKAKDAMERAKRATHPVSRETWLRLAESYRDLASESKESSCAAQSSKANAILP